MRRPTHHPRRPGFTLVELLVVIVVLSMLIALLFPAIQGAINAAYAARVTAEINNLATALNQFKSNFSDYPPSRVYLSEAGNYNTTDSTLISTTFGDVRSDITVGQLSQRTVRYMSKFWPRATCFSTTGNGTSVDYDGSGAKNGPFYVDGTECLVFFLGGMPTTPVHSNPGAPIGMSGFSRNPANPFLYTYSTGTGFPGSTSRTQPLFEFAGSRLVDIDGDGFPSYLDPLASGTNGRPYAYFSAYGTNSYDPNDCDINKHDAIGAGVNDSFSRAFLVNFTVDTNGGYNGSNTNLCVSPAPNPYTNTPPVPSSGTAVWQNPNSFQIISAGANQIFGVGGQFAGNNTTNRLPIPAGEQSGSTWNGDVTGGPNIDDGRNPEADNLSNFTNGRLNQ